MPACRSLQIRIGCRESPATTGGSLTVTVGSSSLGCTLAPGLFNGTVGWKELGNPAGSRGYKYLNKNAPATDPCKVVIVKERAVKVVALGTGTIAAPLDYPPGNPDEQLIWSACYPAAQNLIVAARALGLGATFTTFQRRAEQVVRGTLGIPDEVRMAALIPIGWPDRPHGPVNRKPVEEVIHWQRWED